MKPTDIYKCIVVNFDNIILFSTPLFYKIYIYALL